MLWDLQSSLTIRQLESTILLQETSHRISQRVVASMQVYRALEGGDESIITESSKNAVGILVDRFISLLVQPASLFLRTYKPQAFFEHFCREVGTKDLFPHYHQTVCSEDRSVDAFDKPSDFSTHGERQRLANVIGSLFQGSTTI